MEAKANEINSNNDQINFLKGPYHWVALEYREENYIPHERTNLFNNELPTLRGFLTPEFLVQALQAHFKFYRERRLPPERNNNQVAEGPQEESALEPTNEAQGEGAKQIGFFSRARSRMESLATQVNTRIIETVENLNAMRPPKHTALTLWFESQLPIIMAQRASPRKKMTDLTILLAGFIVHLTGKHPHSETLTPLCRDIYALVWSSTPGNYRTQQSLLRSQKQTFENQFRYQILAASRLADAQFKDLGGPLTPMGGYNNQLDYCTGYQNYLKSRCVENGTYTWLDANQLARPIDSPEADMGHAYNEILDKMPINLNDLAQVRGDEQDRHDEIFDGTLDFGVNKPDIF